MGLSKPEYDAFDLSEMLKSGTQYRPGMGVADVLRKG